MTCVPVLGTEGHMFIKDPKLAEAVEQVPLEKLNAASESLFTLDATVNPHPRFPGLVQSIRERRGEKVCITAPLYKDKNTDLERTSVKEPIPGQIYMDSMAFGMGCSCLQVTFETQTVNHARYLHDQLLPFGGILGALSAASPLYKGQVSDIDFRWNIIS